MITTVTTSTVTTITTVTAMGFASGIAAVSLVALIIFLVAKELAAAGAYAPSVRVAAFLNISIVPLTIVFAVAVLVRIAQLF